MSKDNPDIKILVACHKDDPNIRKGGIYLPVHVGKSLHPELDLGFQGDNTGENISAKNGAYCELTALFWAWKNLKGVDYIGLCHYRRYFDMDMSEQNIINTLKKHDGIVLRYNTASECTLNALSGLLTREDTAIMVNELLAMHPEYRRSAVDYLLNNNKLSQCNMFIMSWQNFDDYCNFIFPLLERIERKMKPHSYSRLKRNLGYMAECLQGLFLYHNRLKLKQVPRFENGSSRRKISAGQRLNKLIANVKFHIHRKKKNFEIYDSVIVGLRQDGIELDAL